MDLSAGPLTGLLAVVAACIGAGALVGGFVAGIAHVIRLGAGGDIAWSTRTGGYIGGIGALLLLAMDTVMR
jgi:hypothetical protein